MDIVEEKSVEKIPESEVQTQMKEEKPKRKPRTEAQKAAFEKARKTRAANLKKKKEEELAAEEYEVIDDSSDYDEPEPEPAPKPKKKGRGRPRGSTKAKKEEARPYPYPTPVGHRIPDGVNHGYLTQSAAHPFVPQPNYNPYGYWGGGMPQQPMAPQPVNNYYYGSQQPQSQPQPETQPTKEVKYTVEEPDEEEYYYEEVQPQQPQLKFRFA